MPGKKVGDTLEIKYTMSAYTESEPPKLLFKQYVKKLVYLSDIRNPTQVVNSKGQVLKTKCKITLINDGDYVINHSYTELVDILREYSHKPVSKIGFKLKTK